MARVDALPTSQGSAPDRFRDRERVPPRAHPSCDKAPREGTSLPPLGPQGCELLYERGVYPDSVYVFKHALTREVVSDSILGKKRRQLHEAIGAALENLHRENLDEHSAALARHFIASENYRKGADYSRSAAAIAIKKASINDAIAWAEKRVACLDKLPMKEDAWKEIIDARTAVGSTTCRLATSLRPEMPLNRLQN